MSLYEGFYGERPFQSTDVGQLVVSVLAGKVRPPPSVDSLPAGLRACLLRGLHVDPAQRFASMNELLDALDAERAKATAAPTIKIRSVAPPATPKGRWIVVGATALSAGLVVGALLVLRGGSSGVTSPNLPASSVAAPGSSAVAAVLPSVGSESPPQVTAASSASAQVAPSVSASAAPRASALAVPSAKAGLAKGKPTSGPSARPPRYDDAPMEPSFVRKK